MTPSQNVILFLPKFGRKQSHLIPYPEDQEFYITKTLNVRLK